MFTTARRTVCSIRTLQETDVEKLIQKFSYYEFVCQCPDMFEQQLLNRRENWIAVDNGEPVGIASLTRFSSYPCFAEQHIPEICGICVLPSHRRRGIATALLNRIELMMLKRSRQIGIALNFDPSANHAQRMFVKRGYIPDGNGLFYRDQTLTPNQVVNVDSNLRMFLIKQR